MNGRIYDPVLGRFLSADPNVDGVSDAQGFNRYSYVGNNPMGATDPTGFFSFKDALKIVAIVVAAWFTAGLALQAWAIISTGAGFVGGLGGALASVFTAAGWSGGGWAIAAGVGAGFGSSFAGSLLNGGSIGDAFKAGVIGGIVGGISAGIAGKIGDFAEGHEWFKGAGQNLAHGAAQGALTELQGGEFRHGFYAGFFSSVIASSGIIDAVPGRVSGKTVASALVGGTASAIGGGKFANGAVSGAFTYLFNHAQDHTKENEERKKVYVLRMTYVEGKADQNSFAYRKIVDDLTNTLLAGGYLESINQIEYVIVPNEKNMLLWLARAESQNARVVILAHGTGRGHSWGWGKMIYDFDWRQRWNEGMKSSYLSLNTCNFYGCNEQGKFYPEEIINEQVKPDLQRYFRKR